jgi:hypothetical protein
MAGKRNETASLPKNVAAHRKPKAGISRELNMLSEFRATSLPKPFVWPRGPRRLTQQRSSDNAGRGPQVEARVVQQFISGSRNSIVVPAMVPPVPMTPVRMGIIRVTVRPPIVPGRIIITRTDIIMWSIKHRYRNREPDKNSRLRRLRSQHPKGEYYTQDQKPLFHIKSIKLRPST